MLLPKTLLSFFSHAVETENLRGIQIKEILEDPSSFGFYLHVTLYRKNYTLYFFIIFFNRKCFYKKMNLETLKS